ncbi:ndk [Lepeophtheirus salmonis]|uniref:Ndk n=1 Tax=Lepeophtheirus salmonis TaxID=72036 RepID=A0A7R8D7W3_LEPSM|nr:ndk [Lepeophtheirus salmonis]CAF3030389.1 ndk [Lepeophtheirus salmonis]
MESNVGSLVISSSYMNKKACYHEIYAVQCGSFELVLCRSLIQTLLRRIGQIYGEWSSCGHGLGRSERCQDWLCHVGEKNPKDSAPGTIRGDFCVQIGRNICHRSDGIAAGI